MLERPEAPDTEVILTPGQFWKILECGDEDLEKAMEKPTSFLAQRIRFSVRMRREERRINQRKKSAPEKKLKTPAVGDAQEDKLSSAAVGRWRRRMLAMGTSSAVGDGNKVTLKARYTSKKKDPRPAVKGRNSCYAREVFSKHGLLCDILKWESYGKGIRGENKVRYLIRLHLNDSNMQAALKTNFDYWNSFMKETCFQDVGSCLFKKIPEKPPKKSWPLAASASGETVTQFRGMLTKYNYEYRRPFLGEAFIPSLDTWKLEDCRPQEIDDRLQFLSSNWFRVPMKNIWHSANKAWDRVAVDCKAAIALDWDEWEKNPSSLVVPTTKPGIYFVRTVLAIGFAALCLLLRDLNSAQEIEEAWLKMPIVKPKKTNRGTSSTADNKWKGDSKWKGRDNSWGKSYGGGQSSWSWGKYK